MLIILCLSFNRYIAYVKSNTVVGDSKHSTGVVMAEIVKANIPVRNGVVHLIHRPLMIVDTTVIQFLEVSSFGGVCMLLVCIVNETNETSFYWFSFYLFCFLLRHKWIAILSFKHPIFQPSTNDFTQQQHR